MNIEVAVPADLIVSDPIKAAIILSKRISISTTEIKNTLSNLKKAVEILSHINQLESNLLPVEEGSLLDIQSKKTEVIKLIRRLQALSNQYAVFSLEPLAWRNNEGFPRLVPFNIKSPTFKFIFDSYSGIKRTNPELPQKMYECYNDIFEKLSKLSLFDYRIELSAKFSMLIPLSIKEKITKSRDQFEEIFIIAEVQDWDLKRTESIVSSNSKTDPLVIGYDGADYWLIAAFDATPLEEYIETEFCVKIQ